MKYARLKPILKVVGAQALITPKILQLARWIGDYYCCAPETALKSALPGCRLVTFGHMGDGNLHYNVQAPEGSDAAQFLAAHEKTANALVFDRVAARSGSFSAEHGIGQLKRDELAARKDPVALALMRSIKQALDPQGMMNPGKLC